MILFKDKGKLFCEIKRVPYSKKYCVYPKCSSKDGLKQINREYRYYIAQNIKAYVLKSSTACTIHLDHRNWINSDICEEFNDFSADMVNDMFNLLTNAPPQSEIPLANSKVFNLHFSNHFLFDKYLLL